MSDIQKEFAAACDSGDVEKVKYFLDNGLIDPTAAFINLLNENIGEKNDNN